jgi:hypothetical protein
VENCNEMLYMKCSGCEFKHDITAHKGTERNIEWMCLITGKTLILKDCIWCNYEERKITYK